MTEPEIATPDIEAPRRSVWRNLSMVWLVPIVALAIALTIAYQAYSERGTFVEILFENASGVVAGETTVRYRDVVIGRVENLSFTDDLGSVIVGARINNAVMPFLDGDATFWVVRPEISSRGVSGLSTVVSGVYIEGAWDSDPGVEQRLFMGRETPLLVQPGQAGRRITLEVSSGQQLQDGAPIFFRGIQVGRIEQPELTEDAQRVRVDAFIDSPHDAQLNGATRFWDASGFAISLGAEGLTLDVESIASLLGGGIEFSNIYSGGDPLPENPVFEVYSSEAEARASAFALDNVGDVPVTVEFDSYIEGVNVGTSVDYRGLQVGEVTAIRITSVASELGRKQRLAVDVVLDPGRMGLNRGAGQDEMYAFLTRLVDDGVRARVSAAGLLTPAVRIALVELPDAGPSRFDADAEPFPVFPSVPPAVSTFNATAEGILDRVSALPFEEVLNQTIQTLASIEDLAEDPALRAVPAEAAGLLTDARDLVTGEDARAIPVEARAALADLRAILDEFRESGTLTALASAAERADSAMVPFAEASEALPEIVENLRQLSETAAALEIEALVATANSVLASADAFISSDEMSAVPEALSGALTELEALVSELSAADVTGSLVATLEATETAAAGLPELVEQTSAALNRVNTLIGAYGTRSEFMTQSMGVLREISAAARSISQLARAIERNPSALLTGR